MSLRIAPAARCPGAPVPGPDAAHRAAASRAHPRSHLTRRLALPALLALACGAVLSAAAPERGPAGGPEVIRGEDFLVVGYGADSALVRDIATRVGPATRQVTEVWGSARPAVVLVPSSERMAGLIAGAAVLDGLAAVATVDRVVVNPRLFARLTATGRDVVLAHELTHVATGAAVSGMPIWLVEGFADYVGYRDAGLPAWEAAAELAQEVREGAVPYRLPERADFRPGAPRLAQVYAESWLACALLAARFGEDALVRLYRDAERRGIDAALSKLGMTVTGLTAEWRVYVRDTLA
ncbi:hypothetical protein SAMN05421505_108245 [Sinosporangium album]|uniref:Uncharacterized protein n=1 Tax=Sinosporangium album TaxID=504805 RepID=A0A1G7XLG8_9ACTN|nr:hypothetical protein [Sinosporangium album]SDG85027.1 hypothetical protein SAMN05421505_108245 [Sinosporangium album]